MHHGIGLEAVDGVAQPGIVAGNVDMEIVDRLAGNAMPGLQALADGGDRGETGRAQFIVDMPAREIVDDTNAIAVGRQMQASRPAAKAITAKDKN